MAKWFRQEVERENLARTTPRRKTIMLHWWKTDHPSPWKGQEGQVPDEQGRYGRTAKTTASGTTKRILEDQLGDEHPRSSTMKLKSRGWF